MRNPPLVKSLIYHVFNRGVSKRKIYLSEQDYRFGMYKMSVLKEKYEINIITFCLMPNHYHVLLYTLSDSKNISKFIGNFQWIYARYFNRRYKHTGHVFESKYKCTQIDADKFNITIDYINQNPVKAKLITKNGNWPYKG